MSLITGITETAKKQVGNTAPIYRQWFYGSNLKGIAWCAIFCSWLASQHGQIGKSFVKTEGAGNFAREGVPKNYGKWYKRSETTPKEGDLILYRYGGSYTDQYHSDHVGYVYSVDKTNVYTIEGNTCASSDANWNDTSSVNYRQRPLSDSTINGYYRPNYPTDTEPTSPPPSPEAPDPSPSAPSTPSSKVDVIYKVQTKGAAWLPEVKNLSDYAGLRGKEITNVAIKVSVGSVKYRVHIKGKNWLPYVTGYDTNDEENGYAGDNLPVDAIEVICTGIKGKKAKYKVSPINSNYFDNQYNDETANGQNGYAGDFGHQIDRIQIEIV